ncbi:hypothetical protein [Bacillus sp. 491mf]|uniref:hypothetical protein n=1 Tax=Bacillus sp. 491mf TaxID=1761755 RepID=UPI0015A5874B|nr:hypothetical protein [Bacillus sp. 491mf]
MDGKIQELEASLAESIRKTGIGVTDEGIPIEEVRQAQNANRLSGEKLPAEGAGKATDELIENAKKITKFDNPADPLRDVFGRGSESNPEEWNKLINELEENGVEVVPGEGAMGYGPLRKGESEQILIDLDASMSALRHEYSHFLEAKANGFPSAAESYQN